MDFLRFIKLHRILQLPMCLKAEQQQIQETISTFTQAGQSLIINLGKYCT